MNDRDRRILTLLSRVRVLSLEQLSRFAFASVVDPVRSARAWSVRMERRELVTRHRVVAQLPVRARELVRWQPGQAAPDFVAVSGHLRHRWKKAPRPQVVLQLGDRGAAELGASKPRLPRRSELAHDLQLAEFALTYHDQVVSWRSECELLGCYQGVQPDAEVELRGQGTFVLEGGGSSYTAERLEAFHWALEAQMGRACGYLLV